MTWRNEQTQSNKALDRVFNAAAMIDLAKLSGNARELVKEILLTSWDQSDKSQTYVLESALEFLGREKMKQIGFLCSKTKR